MQRGMRKCVAFILLAAMVLNLVGGTGITVYAATDYGLNNPTTDSDGVTTWDCIYFGRYMQSQADGSATEPIKWRVLSVDGDDAFLLADQNLDVYPFHNSEDGVTWADSDLRKWLNDGFYKTAFNTEEQNAIRETTVVNDDNPDYGTDSGENTQDKVYVLSLAEACNPDYGFASDRDSSDTRISYNTAYVAAGGTIGTEDMEDAGETDFWWLRTVGEDTFYVANTDFDGEINSFGIDATNDNITVRPALHIDLSKSVWSGAQKITSDGDILPGTTQTPSASITPNAAPAPAATVTPTATDRNDVFCEKTLAVAVGQKQKLTTRIYADSLDKMKEMVRELTWASSDPSVAAITTIGMLPADTPMKYTEGDITLWWAEGLVYVIGKKAGKATITGTLPDGTQAVCNVTITEDTDTGVEGSDGSLKIGEDASGDADDESGVAQFFPASWSMKSSKYPVELSQKENADGTYTIKGSIGIGRSNILDDETTWNKYKKACEDANKANAAIDRLESYREMFGAKLSRAISCSGWSGSAKPSLSMMGYVENTYDKYGNLISGTGKLAGDLNWKGSNSWTFATPIGPMYLKLEAGGKISLNLGPKWDNAARTMSANGSLTLTPSIALTGGYGIDKVASISATGNASLPMQMIPASKGTFSASASVNVKVVFVIDQTWTLATYTKQLWDTTGNKKASKITDGLSVTPSKLKLMSTKKLDDDADWNGKLRKAGSASLQSQTLQKNILDGSLPMIAEADGTKVMVWQAYDSSRSTANSTVLNYSVLEGNTWSEPKAVYDDGHGDAYADLQVIDGKICLTWQKITDTISGTDEDAMLDDMAGASEIYYAEFNADTGAFDSAQRITNNSACDMMPQFVDGCSSVQISYVRNTAGSLLQTEGDNALYTYDLATGTETQTAAAPGTIDRYVSYADGDAVKAVYVTSTDDILAVWDNSGEPVDALQELMRSADSGTVTGLSYQDGLIHMISDGTLYCYDVKNQTMSEYTAGDSAFDTNAVYCSGTDKSGYVWSSYDDETQTGKIMVSMKTDTGYSDPITLYETKGEITRVIAPLLEEDGSWSVALNQENVSDQTHSLSYLSGAGVQESALADAYVNEGEMKGSLTGIDYIYRNLGDTAIDQITVTITAADGTKVVRQIAKHIEPGETVCDTAYVDLTSIDAGQSLSVSIAESSQEASDGNTVSAAYAAADIALYGTASGKDGNAQISITAQNQSSRDAVCSVSLYADENQQTVLDQAEDIAVAANGKQVVNFSIPVADITYNANGAAYLAVKADVTGGDANESDNVIYLALYQGEEIAADTNPKTTDTPKATVAPSNNGTSGRTSSTNAGTASKTKVAVKKQKSASLKKPVIKSAKALHGKKVKITLRKKIKGASGYQIVYAPNKKFKHKKTKWSKKTKITLCKLKAKKTYYIRVRAYKKIGGKKVFGKWSNVKKVKIKK